MLNKFFQQQFKMSGYSYEQYIKENLFCSQESGIVHSGLKEHLGKRSDMSNFELMDKGNDSFCFRMSLPELIGKEKNISSISISVPSDAMGNRIRDGNTYPMAIETALFSGKELVYDEGLGYSDVARFYGKVRASDADNIAGLVTHIHQLSLGQKPDDA